MLKEVNTLLALDKKLIIKESMRVHQLLEEH